MNAQILRYDKIAPTEQRNKTDKATDSADLAPYLNMSRLQQNSSKTTITKHNNNNNNNNNRITRVSKQFRSLYKQH
jgi:hypothetical protein